MNITWQEKYREALLEHSPEELPSRIEAAQRAMEQRLEELGYSATDSFTQERRAIDDARRKLRLLIQTECQNQSSPEATSSQSGSTL